MSAEEAQWLYERMRADREDTYLAHLLALDPAHIDTADAPWEVATSTAFASVRHAQHFSLVMEGLAPLQPPRRRTLRGPHGPQPSRRGRPRHQLPGQARRLVHPPRQHRTARIMEPRRVHLRGQRPQPSDQSPHMGLRRRLGHAPERRGPGLGRGLARCPPPHRGERESQGRQVPPHRQLEDPRGVERRFRQRRTDLPLARHQTTSPRHQSGPRDTGGRQC